MTSRYINTDVVNNNVSSPIKQGGMPLNVIRQEWAKLASDTDTDVMRILKDVKSSTIFHSITIATTAITGFTSGSLGVYDRNNGAAVSAALFMSAQTFEI